MSVSIGNVAVDPPLILAPMAGVTDRDFRLIIRRIGGVGVVTMEFISSRALVGGHLKTLDLMHFSQEERPLSIQIYGSDVDTMVGGIEDQWGPVEVLVNNYGGPGRSTWSTPADAWSEGWNRNVVTAVRLTQRVVPAMRSAGWGRIIVLGTVGTERPGDRNPDYYGAKGALVVLVRSLAKELRGTGVTANLVSPGMIATDEVRSGIQRRAEAEGIEGWEAAARWALQTTMPNLTERIPDPEDIGRMVAFVASEAAWHLTGSDLKADGGALDA